MDRKTLALLLTEVVLIVALVVVIAMDFNSHEPEKTAASHGAAVSADAHEAAAPEAAKEEAHAPAKEEAAEVKEEKKAEEKKHVKKEEKHAKKPAAKKEEAKPAAKAAAPAGDGAVADVIAMNEPAYAKHKKGIVQFTHKKHYTEYKGTCGDCHHDDKGAPLKDLKEGDAVQRCIECHTKAGKAPKPKKGEKMSAEQKREYHTNALHDNCIGCHKDYNKKNKTKAAPTSCGKCHPKKK